MAISLMAIIITIIETFIYKKSPLSEKYSYSTKYEVFSNGA